MGFVGFLNFLPFVFTTETPATVNVQPVQPVTTTVAAPVKPAKSDVFFSGAISANTIYNFNITPNDMSLPWWMRDDVGTDYIIKNIKDAGMNAVTLHFNYALDMATDTFFRPTFATSELSLASPDWAGIEAGADRVASQGLKPVFYMTILPLPQSWDSLLALSYVPKDPDAFFASYKDTLLTIARLSEKYDSPYMSIGVELGPVATDSKYLPYWEDIISSVRQVYHGTLTYSSYVDDTWRYNTELDDLSFTHLIDMLGMNIYPQTLDDGQLNGTYDQFYNEWKTSIVPNLQALIDKLDKPVFISEFGINRLDGTGSRGYWGGDQGMKFDLQEQAELFDASLRAMHEGLNLKGIVFWGANDNVDLVNGIIDPEKSYTNNWIDVPAEQIIQKWANIFLPDNVDSGGSRFAIQVNTPPPVSIAPPPPASAPEEPLIEQLADILVPNITNGGGGGGGGGYPSIESPAEVPGKKWYDDFWYGTGPVL